MISSPDGAGWLPYPADMRLSSASRSAASRSRSAAAASRASAARSRARPDASRSTAVSCRSRAVPRRLRAVSRPGPGGPSSESDRSPRGLRRGLGRWRPDRRPPPVGRGRRRSGRGRRCSGRDLTRSAPGPPRSARGLPGSARGQHEFGRPPSWFADRDVSAPSRAMYRPRAASDHDLLRRGLHRSSPAKRVRRFMSAPGRSVQSRSFGSTLLTRPVVKAGTVRPAGG